MKTNYHTHTFRCKHASGTDRDYVEAAVANGFSELGFSDHVPYPYQDYTPPYRMLIHERDDYIKDIGALKQEYAGKIRILRGFECEALPQYRNYLAELREQADYLILGNHGDESKPDYRYAGFNTRPEHIREYVDSTLKGMEWGIFSYLCHPDLPLHSYPVFDAAAKDMSRQIARAAKALNMPLEYNLNGIYNHMGMKDTLGYPCRMFWEIAAEEGATAIMGVDAHSPQSFAWPEWDAGVNFLHSLGINVLEKLEL